MMCKLKVFKTEENPNYENELIKWKEENRYRNMGYNPPDSPISPLIVTNAMEVELTEEQFEAVKKAVISSFK